MQPTPKDNLMNCTMAAPSSVHGISRASYGLLHVLPEFNSELGKKYKGERGSLLVLWLSPSITVKVSSID
jgi:hypothetical protein